MGVADMIKTILNYSGETGLWLVVGFAAQLCFFSRFLIQWIVSERKRQSVIPVAFWYFSIIGAVGLLVYSLHRRDPVFMIGQSLSLIIYTRNLMLIKKYPKVSNA